MVYVKYVSEIKNSVNKIPVVMKYVPSLKIQDFLILHKLILHILIQSFSEFHSYFRNESPQLELNRIYYNFKTTV